MGDLIKKISITDINLFSLTMPWEYSGGDALNFGGAFHLESTASSFDCSPFDRMHLSTIEFGSKYGSYSNGYYNYEYQCQAIPPGGQKDVARHYKPPYKFPRGGKIALIVVGSIIGAIILLFILRWMNRANESTPKPQQWAERRTRRAGGADGIDLETVGEDGLPSYARVGKPGEVPPGYSSGDDVRETDGASSTAAAADEEAAIGSRTETVASPVYHEMHQPEAEHTVSVPAAPDPILATPGQTVMSQRSLLGKAWFGRKPVPVPAGQAVRRSGIRKIILGGV
jgi:hypothetical protein